MLSLFFSPYIFDDSVAVDSCMHATPAALVDQIGTESGFDLLTGFKFAVTATGRLALVQPHARPNHHIAIIFGCSSSIVLSPSTEYSGDWIVRGEAVEAHNQGHTKKKTFRLR